MNGRLHLAFVALATLSACFSPSYHEGLACSAKGECPGDLECLSSVCVTPGIQAGADARSGNDADLGAADAEDDAVPDADTCVPGSLTIEATGAIVDFVVPDCVTSLNIEVFGAEGGSGFEAAVLGGKGARMKGDFAVSESEILKVLVGMRGADSVQLNNVVAEQGGGTGGGGSFVVKSEGTPLIIAGGGGGATHINSVGPYLWPGYDADLSPNGQTGGGKDPGGGGADGNGGGTYSGGATFHSGTGGGGLLTAGLSSSLGNTGSNGSANGPGSSYTGGGGGGIGGSKGRNGGFGGGGSSGFTGGGGGGYSGGGAGGTITSGVARGGGGGGSFNAGTNPDNSAGARLGDGQVIIVW